MAVKICCHCSKEIDENAKKCPYCKTIVFDDDDGFDAINIQKKTSKKTPNVKDNKPHIDLNSDGYDKNEDEEIWNEIFCDEENYLLKKITKFFNSFINIIRDPRKYVSYAAGMIGCFFMIFGGLFCTYYCTVDNVALGANYLKRDAFFMVMLAIAGGIFIVKRILKFVLIPVIVSIIIMLDLVCCFFYMKEFEYVGAGFLFWCIGTIFLGLSVCFISKQNRHVGPKGRHLKVMSKADLIWCGITIVFAACIVKSICNHEVKIYSNLNNKTDRFVSKEVDMLQGKVNIDVEGAYKTKYKKQSIVVIALKLKNLTNSSIEFDKNFIINVYQNSEELYADSKITIKDLNIESREKAVEVNEEKEMFFIYYLKSMDNIKINIRKINADETSLVLDDTIALKTSADDVPASKKICSKNIESSDISSYEDMKWTVHFKKPSTWGEVIYAKTYFKNDKKEEKQSSVEMEKIKDDIYEYTYNEEKMNNYFIVFSDENGNIYPQNEKGIVLSGNMDIRP